MKKQPVRTLAGCFFFFPFNTAPLFRINITLPQGKINESKHPF